MWGLVAYLAIGGLLSTLIGWHAGGRLTPLARFYLVTLWPGIMIEAVLRVTFGRGK